MRIHNRLLWMNSPRLRRRCGSFCCLTSSRSRFSWFCVRARSAVAARLRECSTSYTGYAGRGLEGASECSTVCTVSSPRAACAAIPVRALSRAVALRTLSRAERSSAHATSRDLCHTLIATLRTASGPEVVPVADQDPKNAFHSAFNTAMTSEAASWSSVVCPALYLSNDSNVATYSGASYSS